MKKKTEPNDAQIIHALHELCNMIERTEYAFAPAVVEAHAILTALGRRS